MNELFWLRSRVPLAEPVKTQIAVRLIVMLGSAPELGFVLQVQKQGNEIVTQAGVGMSMCHPASDGVM